MRQERHRIAGVPERPDGRAAVILDLEMAVAATEKDDDRHGAVAVVVMPVVMSAVAIFQKLDVPTLDRRADPAGHHVELCPHPVEGGAPVDHHDGGLAPGLVVSGELVGIGQGRPPLPGLTMADQPVAFILGEQTRLRHEIIAVFEQAELPLVGDIAQIIEGGPVVVAIP